MNLNKPDFSEALLSGGISSLLLTPFRENGEIDWKTCEAYYEWHSRFASHSWFSVCGTSEMKWLHGHERLRLARLAVSKAGNRPVLATANLSPETDRHPEEMKRMADTGVSGLVLVPPESLEGHPRRLTGYYLQMMDQSPLPVILYEWPQVRHHLCALEVLENVSRHPSFAGLKETSHKATEALAKIAWMGRGCLYQAVMGLVSECLANGGRGAMVISSAALPDLCLMAWQQWGPEGSGNGPETELARRWNELFMRAHPWAEKVLLNLRGCPFPLTTRWPVGPSADVEREIHSLWAQTAGLLSPLAG